MKLHKYILIFVWVLAFGNVFAHQDRFITENCGNVKVRIRTGFKFEEIEKVFLLGQLAEEFAKQLNYSDTIFLDFNHYYIGNCEPDYFISFDKEDYGYENLLTENAIVIRQVARQFDAQTTLKLLEYAILNSEHIKLSQKSIKYNKNYCQWKINSIDTVLIKKILKEPNSIQLNNALGLKLERREEDFEYGILYYLQDNKYTVFFRNYDKTDTNLITLDNVYDWIKFDDSSVLVFDTDSSFYFVNQYKASNRHVLQNIYDSYYPFSSTYFVTETDEEDIIVDREILILIHTRDYKEITFIYSVEKDELIEDEDVYELIKKQ